MDLDKLKKTWQETNITPNLDDSSIERMLNNQGKGAIAALLHTEKLFFKLLIISCLIGCALELFHTYISIFFVALLIPGSAWAIYKINLLKKIDPLAMGILEISKAIAHYKKILIWEILTSLPLLILFFALYIPFIIKPIDTTLPKHFVLIGVIVSIVLVAAICIPIYKNMYFNNIKKIEESIKEIKYFEDEN